MVMEGFGDSLRNTFRKITRMGMVDKEAVGIVVKDLQRALIAADVDVSMVVELSARIKKHVLDTRPPTGITIKEHFIKILYDELVSFLGASKGELNLKPQRILLIGLFGSGKTSTAGKLAKWFKTRGLSVGLAACDTYRPAAKDQLRQLGKKADVRVYETGKNPRDIARAAIKASKEDVLIFDSAGRDALDKDLANELRELGKAAKPDEVLLVIPADIGQAARNQAEEFNKLVGITGIIVTKLDGTARGGGALAAASVSGARVRMIGVGEKLGDLEVYDPKRFVGRLIGYGDIEGLLEKARDVGISKDSAEKLMKGEFTMNEFYEQIGSMQKMGNLSKVIDMIPGASGMKIPKGMLDVQEEKMKKWKFAIDSMTPDERHHPDTIKHSRVQRIARGSGLTEKEVRELLKYFKQTQKVMKMTKGGKGLKKGPLAKFAKQFGLQV
jgi:signal recognition particle subunit SRP54